MKQDELYALVVGAVKTNPKLPIVRADERTRQLRLGMFNKIRREEYYFDLEIMHEDNQSLIRFTAATPKYPDSLVKAAALTLDTIVEYNCQKDALESNIPSS